jgi:hypothetical protein
MRDELIEQWSADLADLPPSEIVRTLFALGCVRAAAVIGQTIPQGDSANSSEYPIGNNVKSTDFIIWAKNGSGMTAAAKAARDFAMSAFDYPESAQARIKISRSLYNLFLTNPRLAKGLSKGERLQFEDFLQRLSEGFPKTGEI